MEAGAVGGSELLRPLLPAWRIPVYLEGWLEMVVTLAFRVYGEGIWPVYGGRVACAYTVFGLVEMGNRGRGIRGIRS